MAATLHFSRNTKVFLEYGSDIWEIPVMDGFSFTQATNASEITLSEAASSSGVSRRAKQMFTDSVAPAEWSFSTYVRPNPGTATTDPLLGMVEEALWALFTGKGTYTAGTGQWSEGLTKSLLDTTVVDFDNSNSTLLGEYTLYFVLGACGDADQNFTGGAEDQTIYKITGCVGNTATIDFDIEGIAQIQWSGFGGEITEAASLDATGAITTGISSTKNFIRNKISSMTITTSAAMRLAPHSFEDTYNLTITAGSITFENNITFLTPETLCKINKPLGHVTGTRTVSGNFTAYLDDTALGTADLWEDMMAADELVTSDFAVVLQIGGAISGSTTPTMVITMPQTHFEIPQHGIEDVITLDTAFHALPSSIDETDEATITYTAKSLT